MSLVSKYIRSTLLAFLITASACVPYPHFRLLMERQSGIVMLHGKALGGLPVWQSYSFMDRTCDEVIENTTTDAKGYFEFPPHSTFTLIATLSDDHHFSSICTEYQGKKYWLMFTQTAGGAVRESSHYQCELEEKKIEKKKETDRDQLKVKKAELVFPCVLVAQ